MDTTTEKTSKIPKIITGLVIAGLIAGGFYLLTKRNMKDKPINENNISTTTDQVVVLGANNPAYTITQVPIENKKSVPIPDLTRPVVFASTVNLTPEVKKMVTEKIASIQSDLKKDSKNLNNWISLGLYQKVAGDYAGAAISWKYVADVANKDFVSYGNLGDLYGYYLHDNAMAETYYKKAIANAPTQSYLYIQLAMLYKDVYKDLNKARSIIDEGLKALPGDKSLIDTRDNMLK